MEPIVCLPFVSNKSLRGELGAWTSVGYHGLYPAEYYPHSVLESNKLRQTNFRPSSTPLHLPPRTASIRMLHAPVHQHPGTHSPIVQAPHDSERGFPWLLAILIQPGTFTSLESLDRFDSRFFQDKAITAMEAIWTTVTHFHECSAYVPHFTHAFRERSATFQERAAMEHRDIRPRATCSSCCDS
jgi:hypothetical protein